MSDVNVSVVFQGSYASWKVLEYFCEISRTWKILKNDFGPGKLWNFKLKVPESPAICWDTDAMMWMRKYLRYSCLHTFSFYDWFLQ